MSGSEEEEDVLFDDDILSGSSEEEEVVFPGSSEEEEVPGEGPGPTIDVDFPDPERFAEPIARRVVQAVAPMYEDLSSDHGDLRRGQEDIRDSIDSLEQEIEGLGGDIDIDLDMLYREHSRILDVAYDINNQLDNQLTENDIRTIIQEETDIDIDVDGEAKDTWGYGFLNLGYDLLSFGKNRLSGDDDHRYEDEHGSPKALPQDENFTRRAVLGMGKETLAAGILGGLGYGISQVDDGPRNGAPEEDVFSMGQKYDLSEVEACAADYQMSQAQQFMNDRGLSEEDIKVEMSTDGSLELYGEDGDDQYTEQLYVTDSVSTWTCDLE